jgi:hypothetical protein
MKNIFGILSHPDYVYLITNDCDFILKSSSKLRFHILQSSFSNGRIVKVMYKCECDVAALASYGLVVVGGFDLGECHCALFLIPRLSFSQRLHRRF